MAETIRDVVIRIAIEQKPFKAVTPDFTPVVNAAKDAARQAQASAASGGSLLSGPISKVSGGRKPPGVPTKEDLDFAEQQIRELDKLLIDMGNAAEKSGKDIDKAYFESMKIMRDSLADEVKTTRDRIAVRERAAAKFKEISVKEKLAAYNRGQDAERAKEAEDAAKRIEAARRREAAAAQKHQSEINTAVEATRSAGEGFFRSLRGGALVFSDTSEGYEKLLENIRYVQGAWDVFSGSLQMGKGALRAWNVVQMAATTAGGYYALTLNMISGAKVRLAAVTATAAAAVRGFTAMLGGPVIATAVAAVAIWGTVTYALGGFSEQAKEADRDMANLVSTAQLLRERLHGFEDVQLGLQLQEELANNPLAKFDEKLASINARLHETRNAAAIFRGWSLGKPLEEASKDDLEGALKLLHMQEQAQKSLIQLHGQKFELLRNEQNILQQNLEKQQQIAAQAKAAAEQERQKVESLQEAIGRLNEVEQLELKRLIEKKKGGKELSNEEAERFGQLGGQIGQDYARGRRIELGKDLAQALSMAFTGRNLTGQGSNLADKEHTAAEERSSLLKQRQEASQRRSDLQQEMLFELAERDRQTEKLFTQILAIIKQFERRQQQLERDVQAAGIGRHRAR